MIKRVYVQADAPYRMLPSDLERLYVHSQAGTMTPFEAFASDAGATLVRRACNAQPFPSINIWGEAPERSSGEACRPWRTIGQAAQGHWP